MLQDDFEDYGYDDDDFDNATRPPTPPMLSKANKTTSLSSIASTDTHHSLSGINHHHPHSHTHDTIIPTSTTSIITTTTSDTQSTLSSTTSSMDEGMDIPHNTVGMALAREIHADPTLHSNLPDPMSFRKAKKGRMNSKSAMPSHKKLMQHDHVDGNVLGSIPVSSLETVLEKEENPLSNTLSSSSLPSTHPLDDSVVQEEGIEDEYADKYKFPYPTQPLRKFTLYETSLKFYLIASNRARSEFRLLKIDRTDPTELVIDEDHSVYDADGIRDLLEMIDGATSKLGGLSKPVELCGLLGFIKFTEGYSVKNITLIGDDEVLLWWVHSSIH
eukprot:TRINITY_DN1839_c0_g1_i3.p1 TRINITY_DN1839_c0_g1~~TRINITY_DN1839_c0_g1_i3.p1  ORF type:complete len:350 (+),score=65.99 TRINITY_DN1839_c0_g1_i3:62-1051(+)